MTMEAHTTTTEKLFRCTLPGRYPAGTTGHRDPHARQGYYVHATDPSEAQDLLRIRLGLSRTETVHTEQW